MTNSSRTEYWTTLSKAALYWSSMGEDSEIRLVSVRTFAGNTARLDAELAKGILQEAGIESEIPGEVAADTFPFLDVQLFVREEDAERAAEVLRSALDAPFEGDQSDETERSEED